MKEQLKKDIYHQLSVEESKMLKQSIMEDVEFREFLRTRLDDFTPEQIIDNYFDFRQYSKECKYNNCNHLGEGVNICAVKRAVGQGEICEDRYMRYCQIYKEAKEQQEIKQQITKL